jgi:hypothetical protein
MSVENIFMLFAPKFSSFGCDVAKELLGRCQGGRVHGLCTGGSAVRDQVAASLGTLAGDLHVLETEEEEWLSTPTSSADLVRFETEFGPGAFGRIVVADRRVGRGFVRSGLMRPDTVGRKAVGDPNRVPQQYVAGLYRFLDAALRKARPSIVFCYAVAGAPAVALAELCRVRRIPFARLSVTRFGGRFLVDHGFAGEHEPVARRFRSARTASENLPAASIAQAEDILEVFRRKPKGPEYSERNRALLRAQTPMSVAVRASIGATRELARLATRRGGSFVNIKRQFFDAARAWRRTLHSGKYFSPLSAIDSPFVYYPLHVDPEASTMVLAPWHTDQLFIIESLAKSAPAHMRLVVKEHAPMLGLRPRGFYRQIARMPRVVLLGPEHSSLDLVQMASLTAVITGTAAWEALCLGRPALIIGNAPFLALGAGFVHEPCPSRFPAAIAQALDTPPAPVEVLQLYIAASLAESFEMPSSLLWGSYRDHPREVRERCVSRIAEGLRELVNDPVALEHSA